MSNIVITVESGADMPEKLAEHYGIHIVPMYVQFGTVSRADGTFPPTDVCRYFEKTGKVPKTSGSSAYFTGCFPIPGRCLPEANCWMNTGARTGTGASGRWMSTSHG